MSVLRRRMFQQGGPVTAPEAAAVQQGAQQVMGQINQEIDTSQNFEQMINATRGEAAPIEDRYRELATIVGPEDAMQTPESVLALAQPVIENALVDEGIGGLAQEQMAEPVGPEMSGGIMEMTQPVQQFQKGGAALSDYYQANLPLIQEILGSEDVKKQAQGQALLDIAQRAFLFGSGVNPATGKPYGDDETEAQKFAGFLASSTTPIGEQLAAYNKVKQAEKLKALEMGIAQKSAADAAAAEKAKPIKGKPGEKIFAFNDKTNKYEEIFSVPREDLMIKGIPESIFNTLDKTIQNDILNPKGDVKGIPRDVFDKLDSNTKNSILFTKAAVKGIPRDIYDNLSEELRTQILTEGPQTVKGIPITLFETLTKEQQTNILTQPPQTVNGIPISEFSKLSEEEQKKILLKGTELSVKGIPESIFDTLDQATKNEIMNPKSPVKGIPRDIFDALNPVDQSNLITPEKDVKNIPRDLFDTLGAEQQAKILGLVDPEKSVKGVPLSIYNTLSDDKKDMLLGVNEKIKGIPRDMFDRFSASQQERLLGIDEDNIKIIGDSAVDFTDPQKPVVVYSSVPDFKKKIEELATFTDMTMADATMAVLGPNQTVKGVPLNIYENLKPEQQNKILGLTVDPIKIGDSLISVENPDKPEVIFTNDKIIKSDNEIVKIKSDGTVEVLYTSPKEQNKKLRVLTDKSNPTYQYYFYEDSKEGAEIIAKANDPKFLNKFSISTIGKFQAPTPQAFIIDSNGDNTRDQVVTTFDGVTFIKRNQDGNYLDENNEISDTPVFVQLQDYNPLQIQDSVAYTINKAQNREATAAVELNDLINDVDTLDTSDKNKAIVKTSIDHAMAGTGLASGFWAFLNNSLGQFIPGLTFPETMQSRDYVKAIDILGRVGLASNQRFAITELLQISQLFPTVSIFKNPDTESQKYVKIKQLAERQLKVNLAQLASGKYTDEVIIRDTQYINKKIRSLLLLLEGVPDSLPSLSDDTVDTMIQSIKKKKGG